jgi:hypothetical protein
MGSESVTCATSLLRRRTRKKKDKQVLCCVLGCVGWGLEYERVRTAEPNKCAVGGTAPPPHGSRDASGRMTCGCGVDISTAARAPIPPHPCGYASRQLWPVGAAARGCLPSRRRCLYAPHVSRTWPPHPPAAASRPCCSCPSTAYTSRHGWPAACGASGTARPPPAQYATYATERGADPAKPNPPAPHAVRAESPRPIPSPCPTQPHRSDRQIPPPYQSCPQIPAPPPHSARAPAPAPEPAPENWW